MNIIKVNQVLANHNHGLNSPQLEVLVPDENNYSILLLQPEGDIEAEQTGIRNRNGDIASAQFSNFLEKAKALGADLVVTPEYSTPWNVLRALINDMNKCPERGKLWALGCESIRYSELQQFRDEVSNHAIVIFEEMVSDDSRFVDPLAYVFYTTESQDEDQFRLVVLVQFKTHAMADSHDFERNILQPGNNVYQFGNYGEGISLTSLICSDVFAVSDNIAQKIYDRSLILHIQMNPEPRHQKFLESRAKLLGSHGDSTEIICLNWASRVKILINNKSTEWPDIAGSAWYGKMQEFDSQDVTLSKNHRRGLYYSTLKPYRAHTLFFNYNPSIFYLIASKVMRHCVPGPVGRRRGPQLDQTYNWNNANDAWETTPDSNDGFLIIVNECGGAADQVSKIFNECPLACERLLALCAGNADKNLDWYHPGKLDSFSLDQNELIKRITFCQDSHPEASQFRIKRLRRCAQLWAILHNPHQVPGALKQSESGWELIWKQDKPHQNLLCDNDEYATVMYLGEDSDDATIKRTYTAARERIRISMDEEAADRAKHRVVLWYRDTKGELQRQWTTPVIDRQRDESEFDIGRMS